MLQRLARALPILLVLGCARGEATSSEHAAPRPRRVGVTDQGENTKDLAITRRIRRAVMSDDDLSFSAKNAKIITRDGRVTLRGSLKSGAERRVLVATARRVAGEGRVEDQLRVKH